MLSQLPETSGYAERTKSIEPETLNQTTSSLEKFTEIEEPKSHLVLLHLSSEETSLFTVESESINPDQRLLSLDRSIKASEEYKVNNPKLFHLRPLHKNQAKNLCNKN